MEVFTLQYFVNEFMQFRQMYGRPVNEIDLAYKALMHLFSITKTNNEEEYKALKVALDLTMSEWLTMREYSLGR